MTYYPKEMLCGYEILSFQYKRELRYNQLVFDRDIDVSLLISPLALMMRTGDCRLLLLIEQRISLFLIVDVISHLPKYRIP